MLGFACRLAAKLLSAAANVPLTAHLDEATAVSDVVFILLGDGGWDVKLVGRYKDMLHRDGALWRFHHRAATFVTEPPPGKEPT